jgi:hypothetical protein
MKTFPKVTLSNGVRVLNFNSPHEFHFEDGSILEAVSNEIALETQLNSVDIERSRVYSPIIDVDKSFEMSAACLNRLDRALEEEVDIILVPLPVLVAIKSLPEPWSNSSKFRTIYVVDRISKKISITKFCR